MPAVLTHKAIMLLARKRLQEIKEALAVKKLAGAVPRTAMEDTVQALATKALDYMGTAPPPSTDFPGAPYAQPLGSGVSKFAVMGAMGPDISGFASALAPAQGWLFDNVHKGFPDENREVVVAGTCDFIFEFWRQVSAAIASEIKDPDAGKQKTKQDKALDMMRAYVLGHLCHLAGDILSHPFINELEWRSETKARNKLEHSDGEASHDALVAQKILLRESTRAGAAWDAWWPTVDEVPSQFFTAYSGALDKVYTAIKKRRTGTAEFEERINPLNPPVAAPEFIRDGYKLYRSGIVSMVYHYTTWNWFAFLLPVWGPIMVMPLLGGAIEITRGFFLEKVPGVTEEQAWSGLLSLGFAFGSAASLTYSIWVAALTMRGVESQEIYGIVANSLATVAGIVFFFSLLKKDFPPAIRFALFIGLPAAVALIQLVMWIVFEAKDGQGRRAKLALVLAAVLLLPVVGALLAVLLFRGLRGDDGKLELGWFLLGAGIWLLAWGALGVLIGWVLRDVKIPEYPKDFAPRKQFVRLFDDATLYRDPALKDADDKPLKGLATQFFPSARRKLLKLWYDGPGDLFVRSDRYRLTFSFVDHSAAADQVVQAPIAPTKMIDFVNELGRLIKGPGGLNKLHAAIVFSGDVDYELPPGGTFSDHGEEESGEQDHNTAAAKFKKIPSNPDDPYFLYHAPKPAQSVRFSSFGPVDTGGLGEDTLSSTADRLGYPYVFDPLSPDDQSVMGYAADMAALLCMGAVNHLDNKPEAERVFQVFRNWSLDRRRVNEWRMLVAGGAVSEKGGRPSSWDPAMLKPADPATWTSNLKENAVNAEPQALSMGWVPTLRTWLEIARHPQSSAVTPDSLRPGMPGNVQVSRGLAFILDLPEPV